LKRSPPEVWTTRRVRMVHDAVQADEVVPRPGPLRERGVADDAEQRAVGAHLPDLAPHGVGHVGVAVLVGRDVVGERRLACKPIAMG
jgi:hypothetical protein